MSFTDGPRLQVRALGLAIDGLRSIELEPSQPVIYDREIGLRLIRLAQVDVLMRDDEPLIEGEARLSAGHANLGGERRLDRQWACAALLWLDGKGNRGRAADSLHSCDPKRTNGIRLYAVGIQL